MRIAQVILAPLVGGAHSVAAALASTWRRAGHTVDIYALGASPSRATHEATEAMFGTPIHVLTTHSTSPMKQATRIWNLFGALRRHPYDVVQSHTLIPNLYARVSTVQGPPVVITLHSGEQDYRHLRVRVAERLLLSRASAIIAVSSEAARAFADVSGAPPGNVLVIPNALLWRPKRRVQFSTVPRVFISTSRLVSGKDIATMMRGFDEFLHIRETSKAELWLAGPTDDAQYVAALRELLSTLRRPSAVSILGPRSDIADLLASADVFIQSSIRETHSMSIIEAAGSGLPIAATAESFAGFEEVLPAVTLFRAGDSSDLARALAHISDRWPEFRDRAAAEAGAIAARFSFEACAAAHMAVLLAAVKQTGRPRGPGA